MTRFQHLVEDLLLRLRNTRVAAFMPAKTPPPSAPAPVGPRPPRWPPKPPVKLPPLPPIQPPLPPLPMPVPAAAALSVGAERYPRQSTTWGLEGGWAPATSGFETRVFDPLPNPKKAEPKVQAFSIFDDLFESG